MTLSISTPAASTAAIASPIRTRRPARLVRNTLSLITKFCEFDVPQPFPHSDLQSLPDLAQGIFIYSSLTPMGEALLREGTEMAVRLEIDAQHAQVLPYSLLTDSVQVLLDLAITNSSEAQRTWQTAMRLISTLNEVASVSSESLLFAYPPGTDVKKLNEEFLATLQTAGISESETDTPGKLYQAFGRRFVMLERKIMLCDLELLKASLHVERLRMLQTAGRFLSSLAVQILDEEFLGSDEYQPGEHPTERDLLACAENPYASYWPSPTLREHEREAQSKRSPM